MTKIKLFNLDLHISVIQDVKNILNCIYGDQIEIVNWSISGHNWVFQQDTPKVEVVNQWSWRSINAQMIQQFQNYYKDFFSSFDGFIVTHTPVFALLYEIFDKPIFVVNSCRYEQPFSWTNDIEMWRFLNEKLKNMWDKKQLIAISNNRSDALYLKLGTGIISEYIPSLCAYTNYIYNPTCDKAVVYGDRHLFPHSEKLVERPKAGYSWKELYSYKAIVHVPYEMSTMSIFEQITAGIPLFFPTRRFYIECIQNGKMVLNTRYGKNKIISEVYDFYKSLDLWLDNADYYVNDETPKTLKYLYYYDSFEDLVKQIESFEESDEIRIKRNEWLQERKSLIFESWRTIINVVYSFL